MKVELTTIKTVTDASGNLDIDVQSEIETEDQLVVTMLLVIEKITGVSTDNYITEVDALRG